MNALSRKQAKPLGVRNQFLFMQAGGQLCELGAYDNGTLRPVIDSVFPIGQTPRSAGIRGAGTHQGGQGRRRDAAR